MAKHNNKLNEKKKLCFGCFNDYYNHGLGNSKECMRLKYAKIVKRKFVPVNKEPPWDMIPTQTTLSCYVKKGYAAVE